MKTKEEILGAHIGESVESVIYEHTHYKGETLISKSLLAMQTYADQQTADLNREVKDLRRRLSDCERKKLTGERF